MILWLNPVSGVSGDMLLAALVDAGAPLGAIRAAVESTGLTGWSLEVKRVHAGAVPAAVASVSVDDPATERRSSDLLSMVGRARPTEVAHLATRALAAIAEVEARIHDDSVDAIHLHEIGGHDTVVDLVGVAAALHLLDVNDVVSAPLPLGTGLIDTRHGKLPAPAPATLALLEGMAVTGAPIAGETVTPTGAALLRAMSCRFDPAPAGVLRATGYGMGRRTLPDRPNVLTAMLLEPATCGRDMDRRDMDRMVLIESNVDDVTGEHLAYAVQALLDLGAADAWISPAVGKKGRPVNVVSVLAHQHMADVLEDRLLAETGSLGARRTSVARTALSRHVDTVEVDGRAVRIKRGPHGHKPEFDDIADIARADGIPLRVVGARALAAYDKRNGL